jgi:hypothetical protein
MTPEEIADKHPRLYHLAEYDAVPSILKHGLWSAEVLARDCGLSEAAQDALLRHCRKKAETLNHPVFGRVTISDNSPLSRARLALCLDDGLSASDWLSILNGLVFFFPNERMRTNFANLLTIEAGRKRYSCSTRFRLYDPASRA